MNRGIGGSSLVSPYGGPPIVSPPPAALEAAITGHLYRWTDFLLVTSSSAIPETAQHSPPMLEWNLTGSTPTLLPTCHRGGIQQSGQQYFPPEADPP